MSKLNKECSFRVVKATDSKPWTLTYKETLEAAKAWVAGCSSYAIYDCEKAELVEHSNWDLDQDRRVEALNIDPVVHIERVTNND